jgi:hypothetical protein
MSLVHHGPAFDTINESVARSITFPSCKIPGAAGFSPGFSNNLACREFYLAVQQKMV